MDGNTTDTKYTVTELEAETDYHIGIEAVDSNGGKSVRLKSTITTLATPTSIIDAEVAFIQLYPNPIKTVLNIQCQEAIIERVVIYNTMGSCIYVEACNQNYANVEIGRAHV